MIMKIEVFSGFVFHEESLSKNAGGSVQHIWHILVLQTSAAIEFLCVGI